MICYLGLFVAIELKATRRKSRSQPLQEYNIDKIRSCGGNAAICYSVKDIRMLLENVKKHVTFIERNIVTRPCSHPSCSIGRNVSIT